MSVKIRCLLLVEDEAEVAARTAGKLAGSNLQVAEMVVATSLAQAVKLIVSREIDIVLLDLDLGDSKSLDTLTAVRSLTDAVVIVLAATDDELLGVECLKAGADDFLVKDEMTEVCLRHSISKSLTRRNIRRAASRIESKVQVLSQMAGVT